jgi:hypothetical protein
MIFAREISGPLTSLVKKIDAATAKNSKDRMGSFVVFLSDEEGLRKQLKALATKEHLSKTVLSIDNPAGPPGYEVSKDADITVVLYTKRNVKANYAFRKASDLDEPSIDRIMSDIPKILPKKK